MWARARLTATLGHQRLASGARLALVCLVALIISQECWQAVWGSAASQQYFEVQPEAQNLVANGQEARLRCLVRNRQGECAWIRNGLVIGPIKSKYSYARQPDDGDCSILIRNASVQLDDGLWQCQVLATELDQPALQSRQVSLVVVVAPERPQFKDAVSIYAGGVCVRARVTPARRAPSSGRAGRRSSIQRPTSNIRRPAGRRLGAPACTGRWRAPKVIDGAGICPAQQVARPCWPARPEARRNSITLAPLGRGRISIALGRAYLVGANKGRGAAPPLWAGQMRAAEM